MRAAEQQPALSTDYMQIMVWNETLSAQPALGDDVPVCADLVRYKYAWGAVVLLCVCAYACAKSVDFYALGFQ